MADFSARHSETVKQMVAMFRCSVCRRRFGQEQVRVAAHQDELWFVSVRCAQCRNQQVFWLSFRNNSDASAQRDLSDAEQQRFASLPPVTCDEILDLHEFLGHFNGDFKTLFGR